MEEYKLKIDVMLLNKDAKLPTYATFGDAGADLYSTEEIIIEAQDHVMVGTGISMAIPQGFVGLVHPRSGLAAKNGITVLNAPGTIDAGYRGEIKVILVNHTNIAYMVKKGDKIAQLIIQKVEHAFFEPVQELDTTNRGAGGFGSTGK